MLAWPTPTQPSNRPGLREAITQDPHGPLRTPCLHTTNSAVLHPRVPMGPPPPVPTVFPDICRLLPSRASGIDFLSIR